MPQENSAPTISDDIINAATASGKKIKESQSSFSFPDLSASPATRDALVAALLGQNSDNDAFMAAGLGLAGGAKAAADINKFGSPIASGLAAFGGGIAAGAGIEDVKKKRAEAAMAQLENIPIQVLSPRLVEEYQRSHNVDLTGVPAGMINKLKPLFDNDLQTRLLLSNIASDRKLISQQEAEFVEQQNPAIKAKSIVGLDKALFLGIFGAQRQSSGPEIVTKDGQQFVVNRDAKGNPRYTPNSGSQIQAEVGTKLGLAQDGLANLDTIETMLKSPKGRELALKAGGSFEKLKTLGDPDAEILANAIMQAGDAEARVKSGAAMREGEEEIYFRNLVKPVGTMAGNLDRIARKKAYFNGQIKIYGQGRNIPVREGTEPLRRQGKVKGSSAMQNFISNDGGKTWEPE